MYPHIQTSASLTFMVDDKPHSITKDHDNFEKVLKRVRNKKVTEKTSTKLMELIKPVEQFKRIFSTNQSSFSLENDQMICTIDGNKFPLTPSLHKEILNVYNSNGDLEPLYNFVVKLAKNPRKEVIDELWGFISSCGLAITESGNFLAYKNVRNNFNDIFSDSMSNAPGEVLKMERWEVEHDPNRTCASGLHFAAWGYLQHYACGGKTVILSISPEHVVSIPRDYNNMKGRACEYKILREVEQPEELKNNPVYSDEGVAQSRDTSEWLDAAVDVNDLYIPFENGWGTDIEVTYYDGSTDFGELEDFEYVWDEIKMYRVVDEY